MCLADPRRGGWGGGKGGSDSADASRYPDDDGTYATAEDRGGRKGHDRDRYGVQDDPTAEDDSTHATYEENDNAGGGAGAGLDMDLAGDDGAAAAAYRDEERTLGTIEDDNDETLESLRRRREERRGSAGGIALPLREPEYDDRVDYAADVSVMVSLGGPSLLVERARHEQAMSAGAGRTSFEGARNAAGASSSRVTGVTSQGRLRGEPGPEEGGAGVPGPVRVLRARRERAGEGQAPR